MRCEAVNDSLRVTPSRGRPYELDFTSVDVGPNLRKALMERFIDMAGPSGSWGTKATTGRALTAVRAFFSDLGVVNASDLTGVMYRERLMLWTNYTRYRRHRILRVILPTLPGISAECAHVIESTTAPRPEPQASDDALTDEEIELLRLTCVNNVRDALTRVKHGWDVVDAYQRGEYDDRHPDYEYAQFLDEVARTGDVADRIPGRPSTRRVPPSVYRRLYPNSKTNNRTLFPLWENLYPTPAEVAAALLALIITCGWNLGTALTLDVSDVNRVDARDGSEPLHLRVTLTKPRRGVVSEWTETYTDNGPRSKARLIQMILELTDGARRTLQEVGYPTDAVLVSLSGQVNAIGRNARPVPLTVLVDANTHTIARYLRAWRGEHPELDFATPIRLRSYFATQVHPQGHSLNTNIDYNLNDPTVKKAVQPVIATVLQDHFHAVQARVVNGSATVDDLPPDSRGVLEDVNSGARDTVASACVDHEHAPDTHEPCRASFLTCFACTNAVVLKRHLPRVVALHDHLEGLRAVTPAHLWDSRFAAHHARIASLLVPNRHFSNSDLLAARADVTDTDRDQVNRLMNRTWDT